MQRDFTLRKYEELCIAIKENYKPVTVLDYLLNQPENSAILRHDVDASPGNALKIAKLENELGIPATYYFRTVHQLFNPPIIRKICDLGHEIGYHYEVLDKTNGNFERAIELFGQELEDFRKICDVKTICMHGNPLTSWNNSDLWKRYDFRDYGVIGDAYLSIDYSKVVYFTETGRDWKGRYSIKDRVAAENPFLDSIDNTDSLIELIRKKRITEFCILTHPKRWNDQFIPWLNEFTLQSIKNLPKIYLKRQRRIPVPELRDKLRILVDIGHPAHVHFFKNTIWNLEKDGHEVMITARDKEVSLELLDAYGFKYTNMGKYRKGLVNKATGMLTTDYKLYRIARKFKPDILTGIGSMYAAQVGKLTGRPSIIFTDTEHAKLFIWLTDPFATVMCTPTCFKKNLGSNQIRYNGYHELAYLHPDYFKPDPNVLKELNLKKNERFFILRFVSWEASHDIGQKGLDKKTRRNYVKELEDHGTVLITSEAKLDMELDEYRITIPPERIHDLLHYSTLYIGEGATMATEAAILGTPSIYISSLVGTMGNFDELEKYGLVHTFTNQTQALEKAISLLKNKDLKHEWQKKREKLLEDKIDVTKWMTKFIETYPVSFNGYPKNGDSNY